MVVDAPAHCDRDGWELVTPRRQGGARRKQVAALPAAGAARGFKDACCCRADGWTASTKCSSDPTSFGTAWSAFRYAPAENARRLTRCKLVREWCRKRFSSRPAASPGTGCGGGHTCCMQLATTSPSQSRELAGHRLNQPWRRKHSRSTRLDDRTGHVSRVWTRLRSCRRRLPSLLLSIFASLLYRVWAIVHLYLPTSAMLASRFLSVLP